MPILFRETPRLRLRAFELADVEVFSAYRSDPGLARFQSWEAPYSLAQAQAFIEAITQTEPGTPGKWCQVALELKATGQLIGDCGFLVLAEVRQQAEIGYTLARAYHGQGYMTEAGQALLTYLFETFGLHRICAFCDVGNTASQRVLERLGMRREGHFIESFWLKQQWHTEYGYALLRREWEAKRQTAQA